MKTLAAVGLVLLSYAVLAVAQDEPVQVWLLVFAPFALVAIALVFDISDTSGYD